jgi:hypothetical protein
MAEREGTRLGDYELVERIGSDGMAEVHRAKQLMASRPARPARLPDRVTPRPARKATCGSRGAIARTCSHNCQVVGDYGHSIQLGFRYPFPIQQKPFHTASHTVTI